MTPGIRGADTESQSSSALGGIPALSFLASIVHHSAIFHGIPPSLLTATSSKRT